MLAFFLVLRGKMFSSLTTTMLCALQMPFIRSFPGGSDGRVRLQGRRPGLDPWVGKIPWRREWQPTLVFLPGESQGQRSLAGYV